MNLDNFRDLYTERTGDTKYKNLIKISGIYSSLLLNSQIYKSLLSLRFFLRHLKVGFSPPFHSYSYCTFNS